MRSAAETHSRWQLLFEKFTDLGDLKAAIKENGDGNPCNAGLRSICWKAFLLFHDLDRAQWKKQLSDSREAYTSLKEHFLKNIENSDDISAEDPLSDSESSPWTVLRFDEELRAEIWQDVERCMPENSYFREPATQAMLLDILFIYCKLNKDIGYRQGMHEVLAPILWVMSCDAIEADLSKDSWKDIEEIEKLSLDQTFIEHDAFTLFGIVMQSVRAFYEIGNQSEPQIPGLVSNSPIVQRSKRIHEYFLLQTDPELAEHLAAIEILPQIFIIRWVRLIFGREFPFEDVLSLWDLLFAEDPHLDLIDLISVSMLLRIRWQLLEADYTGALTLLLRYPAPTAPYKAITFVSDAMYLRDNLNLDGGDHIISKYSSRAPETTVTRKLPRKVKRARTAEQVAAQQALEAIQTTKTNPLRRRKEQKGIDEIIQDTAKGLYTQGEKWGVNKALRGAVQSLQANHVTPRRVLTRSRLSIDGTKPSSDQTSVELLKKIEFLERRNKGLAELLDKAMKELWTSNKANKTEKDSTEDKLSLAIAKVQFVQVYLENSSMALPTHAETEQKGSKNEPSLNFTTPTRRTVSSQNADLAASEILTERLPPEDQASATKLPSPSLTSTNFIPKTPPSKPIVSPESLSNEISPSRQPRPALAQSPYSWMLGEDKPKSAFVSTSPLATAESTGGRRMEVLFHDQAEGGSRKGVIQRAVKHKATPSKEILEDADVFSVGAK